MQCKCSFYVYPADMDFVQFMDLLFIDYCYFVIIDSIINVGCEAD